MKTEWWKIRETHPDGTVTLGDALDEAQVAAEMVTIEFVHAADGWRIYPGVGRFAAEKGDMRRTVEAVSVDLIELDRYVGEVLLIALDAVQAMVEARSTGEFLRTVAEVTRVWGQHHIPGATNDLMRAVENTAEVRA